MLEAPSADELLGNATVTQVLEEAWQDSQPDDPLNRHEEGGWIYMKLNSRGITVRRAARGSQAAIDLSDPPIVDGSVVIGKFHTHPNPSDEGWNIGPSPGDQRIDAEHGVPDLIRADDGIHFSGPEYRRGGLAGGPGYPA